MRRTHLATVVEFLIAVVVALGTRIERAFSRTKLRPPVLRMTIDTPDPRRLMRLDHRRLERFRRVASSTSLFHVLPQ